MAGDDTGRNCDAAPIAPRARPGRLGIVIASLQQGGAERASLGLLDALLAEGRQAYLITIDRNREMSLSPGLAREPTLAHRIVTLSGSDINWGTATKTLIGPWHLWKLYRAVRRLRLDVVLSIMERANILNLLAPGRHKRVLSIRSYPSAMLLSKAPLKRFLIVGFYRILLRRTDRLVVVSREAAADFGALFPEVASRIAVIYNACDVDRVVQSGAQPFPEASFFDRPTLVSVGRLIRDKGHEHLLRAFAEVARRHRTAQLAIVGSGPLESELVALRDALGLAERVLFAGFRPNPMPWMARARAFVLPSVREGFPNSLLEALALGVPAIASDCRSGPREVLSPGTDPTRKTSELEIGEYGLLVPPCDGIRRDVTAPPSAQEQILADAMIRLLEDDELHAALSLQARRRSADFVPKRILPEWLNLIDNIAAAGMKRPS